MPNLERSVGALILHKTYSGDSDVYLELLSAELGRIGAVSRGAKHLKSRLRYALEPYSVIQAVILPTRAGGWQLINAELSSNLFYDYKNTQRQVLIRLFELLRRVLPSNEPSTMIKDLVELIIGNTEVVIERYLYLATFVLSSLGYLDLEVVLELPEFTNMKTAKTIKNFIYNSPTTLSDDSLLQLKKIIQQALKNSQL